LCQGCPRSRRPARGVWILGSSKLVVDPSSQYPNTGLEIRIGPIALRPAQANPGLSLRLAARHLSRLSRTPGGLTGDSAGAEGPELLYISLTALLIVHLSARWSQVGFVRSAGLLPLVVSSSMSVGLCSPAMYACTNARRPVVPPTAVNRTRRDDPCGNRDGGHLLAAQPGVDHKTQIAMSRRSSNASPRQAMRRETCS